MSGSEMVTTMHNSFEIGEANARLIAAAPELLEACKVAVSIIDYLAEVGECPMPFALATPSLKTAIAKAEGKA
jgi:hypothetical protein